MDKEEARFILRCFRPDGSDAADPEFSKALQVAASDRELGEWLAKERAQDSEFSNQLGKLPLPEGLREEILAGLAAERGDLPQADEIDASLIGALAMVRPPDDLRDEIIAAMNQSAPSSRKKGLSWWRFGVPLAAAAGIALAIVFSVDTQTPVDQGLVSKERPSGKAVPVSFVQAQVIETLESPDFSLDLKNSDQKTLFEFIRSEGRACPSGCVPAGLENVDGLGCRVIEVDGKPGAIVCFKRGEGEIVHLVVFRREDVTGEFPKDGHPELNPDGSWAVARWGDKDRVFVLLGQTNPERLGELF
jgi:hypothetical protein